MRISTSMIHGSAASAIQLAEANLSVTQNQISSGLKVQKPSDDPVAAVRIMQLQQQQLASDQYGKNISAVTNRLNLDEQGLADTSTLLQRVRELVVQGANTGSLTNSDRQSIATEISANVQALQDIANRKDSNGDYLYAGQSTQIQPFVRNGSGVMQYGGDQGNRMVQVGPSQRVIDGHSGYDVFINIPEGNGTFATAATVANTGSGSIDVGSVTNKAVWVPDNYTLGFTSATTWQVTDSLSNVVTTGNYTAGSAIAFNGVQVTVNGAPATGDSFAINQSHTQDIFKTLDNIISTLSQPSGSDASNAMISTALGNSLQQLDQANDHFSNVRAQVGARLNTLDVAEAARTDTSNNTTKAMSDLRDLDFATALTKYNEQTVVLQAAQQSYAKIAQLSLFNYL